MNFGVLYDVELIDVLADQDKAENLESEKTIGQRLAEIFMAKAIAKGIGLFVAFLLLFRDCRRMGMGRGSVIIVLLISYGIGWILWYKDLFIPYLYSPFRLVFGSQGFVISSLFAGIGLMSLGLLVLLMSQRFFKGHYRELVVS